MIALRKNYEEEDDEVVNAKTIEYVHYAEQSGVDPDTPCCFDTGKYKTFIAKDKYGNYNVHTDEHLHWWKLSGTNNNLKSEFCDLDENGEIACEDYIIFPQTLMFYRIETGEFTSFGNGY
jgi:hypothetical protein